MASRRQRPKVDSCGEPGTDTRMGVTRATLRWGLKRNARDVSPTRIIIDLQYPCLYTCVRPSCRLGSDVPLVLQSRRSTPMTSVSAPPLSAPSSRLYPPALWRLLIRPQLLTR